MKQNDVIELAESGSYLGRPLHANLEETHISWVLLSKKYAFKLKKPVKFSFLDFSTLRKRKKFCERELALNRRFSNIYKAVLPVCRTHDHWNIGEGHDGTRDYVVQMKRLSAKKKMDEVLAKGQFRKAHVHALAGVIADFHRKASIIKSPFDLEWTRSVFNDIGDEQKFLSNRLGKEYGKLIKQSIHWSDSFLNAHSARISERIREGFKRDVHGDLHSGNIFLYKKPVLFDCIEFNDTFRHIDLLNEIAFFCMDLDAYRQHSLGNLFLDDYLKRIPCMPTGEDRRIFLYFKCYRANVRSKIHALAAIQEFNGKDYRHHVSELRKYLKLMKSYIRLVV